MEPLNWQNALNWEEINWWTQIYQRAGILSLSHLQRGRSFNPSLQGIQCIRAQMGHAGTHWDTTGYQRTLGALQLLNPHKKSKTLVKKIRTLPCLGCWEETGHCRDREGQDSVWVTHRTGETWHAQIAGVLYSTKVIPQEHKYRRVHTDLRIYRYRAVSPVSTSALTLFNVSTDRI